MTKEAKDATALHSATSASPAEGGPSAEGHEALDLELKRLIVDTLMLEDVVAEEIDTLAPLFGDGLGLDSIDALELALAIHKRFGVKTAPDDERNREYFFSVASLREFVLANRPASKSA